MPKLISYYHLDDLIDINFDLNGQIFPEKWFINIRLRSTVNGVVELTFDDFIKSFEGRFMPEDQLKVLYIISSVNNSTMTTITSRREVFQIGKGWVCIRDVKYSLSFCQVAVNCCYLVGRDERE